MMSSVDPLGDRPPKAVENTSPVVNPHVSLGFESESPLIARIDRAAISLLEKVAFPEKTNDQLFKRMPRGQNQAKGVYLISDLATSQYVPDLENLHDRLSAAHTVLFSAYGHLFISEKSESTIPFILFADRADYATFPMELVERLYPKDTKDYLAHKHEVPKDSPSHSFEGIAIAHLEGEAFQHESLVREIVHASIQQQGFFGARSHWIQEGYATLVEHHQGPNPQEKIEQLFDFVRESAARDFLSLEKFLLLKEFQHTHFNQAMLLCLFIDNVWCKKGDAISSDKVFSNRRKFYGEVRQQSASSLIEVLGLKWPQFWQGWGEFLEAF